MKELTYGQKMAPVYHAPGRFNMKQVSDPAACVYVGGPTGETMQCNSCTGKVMVKTFSCSKHGCCTIEKRSQGIQCCKHCPDRKPRGNPVSYREVEIDLSRLTLGEANAAFNASLLRYKGRLLMAYRTGWKGAMIHIAVMSEDLIPLKNVTLHGLEGPRGKYGREDPRLFVHKERLYLSYIGVMPNPGGAVGHTSVQYALLRDDLSVESVHYPHYAKRQPWEKNHLYFEWRDMLLCVYSISPHLILNIIGEEAHPFTIENPKMPWSGGHLRGGASPVLIDGEWWCWFHGKVGPGHPLPIGPATKNTYSMGVYCFSAEPPFRPIRITPDPVLWARPQDAAGHVQCVFPCGAVLDGDCWRVSCGLADRRISVFEFSHKDIQRVMVKV